MIRRGSMASTIEIKPWDELLTSLPSKLRITVRQTLRRAEEDGVRSVLAGPEEAEHKQRVGW
jgi:hypothetical protein